MAIDWKREIRRLLSSVELEPTREQEIVDEISQHLDDRYEESLASGANPVESYLAVLAELSKSELLTRELRRVERCVTRESALMCRRLREWRQC